MGRLLAAALVALTASATAAADDPILLPITLEPGDLLVSDAANGWIVRVVPSTGAVDFFSPLVPPGLGEPGDLVQAPDGAVLVVDRTGGRLMRIDPATGVAAVVETFAGCLPGETCPLEFDQPWGVAVDANGTVYVADRTSGTYRLTPDPSLPGVFDPSFLVGDGVFFGTRSLAVTSDGAGDADQIFLATEGPGDLHIIDVDDKDFFSPPGIPTVAGSTLYGADVVGNCLAGQCTVFFTQSHPTPLEACDATGLYSWARDGMLALTSTLFDVFPQRCVFDVVASDFDEAYVTTAESLLGGTGRVVRMYQPAAGQPWDGIVVADLPDGTRPPLPSGITRVTVRAPEPSATLQALGVAAVLAWCTRRAAAVQAA